MPIYDYECDGPAKHRFEKWQSMKDDPVQECPECGTPVHKIFHPAGIIFKGSGWYITDSRKPSASETKSDKADAKSESKEQPKSESKAEPKTESKSESSASSSSSDTKSASSSE